MTKPLYEPSADNENSEVINTKLIVTNNSHNNKYYFDLLNNALRSEPYREIISTEVKALAVLSQEVIDYNNYVTDNHRSDLKIMIDQHLTAPISEETLDLLFSLTAEQRQQVRLYGVDLTDEMMHKLYLNGDGFAGIYRIDPKNDSITKEEFKDEKYDNYLRIVDNLRDLCDKLFSELENEKKKITEDDYNTMHDQISLLKNSLSPNRANSNQEKLKDFREQFKSSAEKALNSLDGGLIKSIILQIKYQLSKLFSIKSTPTFFSAKEDLINKVEDSLLKNDNFKP